MGFFAHNSDIAEASGSMTVGLKFSVGRPESMKGPRCLDVTLNPYLQFGAGLVLWLLPDVSVTIPAWEGAKIPLYQGPCWGFSGSVTYTLTGRVPDCSDPDRGFHEYDESLITTLLPQPARFVSDGI